MTTHKHIVILSSAVILIAVGIIAISSTKDVQAHESDWSWSVDRSCKDGPGVYHCNIPDDLGPGALIPDLREAVPAQIGLQNTQQKTTLRLTTSIANTGDGTWQMISETPATETQPQLAYQQLLNSAGSLVNQYQVSQFEFHPAHNHFHIAAVSSYELHQADGPNDTTPTGSNTLVPGAEAQKVTFCLIDWVKIDDNSPNNERAYSDCAGEFQGVSPGWMDQYHHELEGQELDVTNVPSGYYFIVVTANPEHHFIETDFTNNQAWILIKYTNDSKGNPKLQIINESECPEYPGLCEYSTNR